MIKKIAQWIRTRQERRLRKKIIMNWDVKSVSNPYLVRAADGAVKFILTGEIPPSQDNHE